MINIFGETEFKKDLLRVFDAVANHVSFPKKVNVNLIFVSKEEIRELNKTTRNIDKVTDVLTYPYVDLQVGKKLRLADYKSDVDLETGLLTIGDIYICLDRAEEQAKEYNHTIRREVCFLLCHGLLHIAGYDHIEKADEEQMTALQEEIMNELNITREQFKCGFVTIIGETNAGKSTLINLLANMLQLLVLKVKQQEKTFREFITTKTHKLFLLTLQDIINAQQKLMRKWTSILKMRKKTLKYY